MTDLNELLKQTSRSLYLSARLLPANVRGTFCVAYLLCRYADSIADTSLLPPEQRLHWIEIFPALVQQPDEKKVEQLVHAISPSVANQAEEKLLRNFPACATAFNKLNDFERQATLDVVQAVCEGMKIDLQTFPDEKSGKLRAFQTPQELENYCHLMGGEPGRFWSRLIDHTHASQLHPNLFLPLGKDIGDGLQIVNILRDLPRDLRIGRCYIPSDDLVDEGLIATDLLKPEFSAKFEPVKRKWITWARKKLQSAHRYFAGLPITQPRHRAAVAWPILWAADTLNLLEQEQNLLDPHVRVKISRTRVYGTMATTPLLLISDFAFDKWLDYKLSGEK
ncbi:MAG: squalene/phytoene synthase family protein [Elusimicrobiaceae bacterium]|nr:squalene/phytoene synthase family protein [Elusimicrobiaceae bacterium]